MEYTNTSFGKTASKRDLSIKEKTIFNREKKLLKNKDKANAGE